MPAPRRLIFGEVAELYDRHRPSYPPALIDQLIDAAGGVRAPARALEVGAGTGKATALFAARGVDVLAIEPSAEMAAVARRNLAGRRGVQIVQSDFERWDPAGEHFPLLYSAQAWHWIEPGAGLRQAHRALAPDGLLAAFWNRPAWGRSALRDELVAAYRATVPELPADGPLHPANRAPEGDEDWAAELAAAGGFTAPEVRHVPWQVTYSAQDYGGLLGTLSEIRLLAPDRREALIEAVTAAITRHGGRLQMAMTTRVCLARAL